MKLISDRQTYRLKPILLTLQSITWVRYFWYCTYISYIYTHTHIYIYVCVCVCVCVFVLYCLCRFFCFTCIYIYIYIYRKHNGIDNIKSTHGTTAIKFTSPKNGKQNPNIGTVLFSSVIRGLALNYVVSALGRHLLTRMTCHLNE